MGLMYVLKSSFPDSDVNMRHWKSKITWYQTRPAIGYKPHQNVSKLIVQKLKTSSSGINE